MLPVGHSFSGYGGLLVVDESTVKACGYKPKRGGGGWMDFIIKKKLEPVLTWLLEGSN